MAKNVLIGFITYGESSLKYLPEFVESLTKQSYQDFDILVWDNSLADDERNSHWLKQNLPQAKITRAGKNLGFAKGANQLMTRAKESGSKYFFLVNPDTVLDELVLEKLVKTLDEHPGVSTASPKVLRWDFANKIKTNIIDTCGLLIRLGFKFVDVGQGEVDHGQFNQASILGPSGCSAFFRVADLASIKFDERFFMYKEDADLAYQFFLSHKKCLLASEALVYHNRTVVKGLRSAKGQQEKIWSFYGQHLLILKYWKEQGWWSKTQIIWREIFMLAYVLVFEPYLLRELRKVISNLKFKISKQ